ncbi:MAG: hypothetical protein WCA12_00260 [Burkholderiales bacterium]
MQKKTRLAVAGLALSIPMSMAQAAEKTLEFQLVTKALDPRVVEAPNVEGQSLTQARAFGVAAFPDGRVGTKDFVFTSDLNKGAGTMVGYSTYYFDDGSITARFTADAGAKGMQGKYTILSGTGVYAGAQGTGTFETVANPFKNANLFKARLDVVTP